MKTRSIIFFLALAFLSFVTSAQTLPKTWQPGMKLESSYGGGMMYYRYKIIINDSLSTMVVESNKGKESYERKFTKPELDSLLAYLNIHRFDQIKDEFIGMTHDKASESILLTWDYKVVGASENSSNGIVEEYKEDFNAIQAHLMTLFTKKHRVHRKK